MNNALACAVTSSVLGLVFSAAVSASPLGEPIQIKGRELKGNVSASPQPLQPAAAALQSPISTSPGSAVGVGQVPLSVAREFIARPADGSFRTVLKRWSADAGWTFDAEHWQIDRDIPVSGAGALGTDYKQAVKDLLRATLMGDVKAKPCFYSNRVLRVVPVTTRCDESKE